MRTRVNWLALIVGALMAAALLVACGDDGNGTATATMTEAAATEDDHDEEEDAHEEDEHQDLALFDETAAETITIELQDIQFVPDTVTIQAGELVELVLENTGAAPHDFTIEEIDADHAYHEAAAVAGHDEHGEEFAMHHALEAGDSLTMRLRVHEPGEYRFYCTVPGHEDAGMVGTLIVE